MNYIKGELIRELREKKHFTQNDLADKLMVSDKTISKWETGRGLPDISLIEPLANSLGISVVELMTGDYVTNKNISSNMIRSKFYICPICGNIIHAMGESVVSCCGIVLPVQEIEEADSEHEANIERIENEHYVTLNHPMEKNHYISFIAYVTSNKLEIVKLYPEGNAEARFLIRGHGIIYWYCNKHGLMKKRV